MFDFIPVHLYTDVFNYLVLLLICGAYIGLQKNGPILGSPQKIFSSVFLMLTISIYMGLRQNSAYFGDTVNYAAKFHLIQSNLTLRQAELGKEWIFEGLMVFFAKYSNLQMFFLSCAIIYMSTLWLAMYRFFGNRCYIPFLVAMSMFTFWAYGVNGIRNGMAASITMLALSFRPRYIVMACLSVIALGIHQSLMLTLAAAALAWKITNPKIYLAGWLGMIVISSVGGDAAANFLLSTGIIEDERLGGYLTNTEYSHQFSSLGFRWDFLMYSAMPVAVGYYFIFKRNYTDTIYIWLFNIYLTVNAFWILVINAQFSNRFAQISWFIMPIVLIYPFIKYDLGNKQARITANAIIVFYLFTFYSAILLTWI